MRRRPLRVIAAVTLTSWLVTLVTAAIGLLRVVGDPFEVDVDAPGRVR
jgi:hypothetical protein